MTKDVAIFKEYLAQQNGDTTITKSLKKLGLSRSGFHKAIKRIRDGNPRQVSRYTEQARLEFLWEHNFKSRFLALSQDRRPGTVRELKAIIREMREAKFPQTFIAKKLKKERTTIIHHLKS